MIARTRSQTARLLGRPAASRLLPIVVTMLTVCCLTAVAFGQGDGPQGPPAPALRQTHPAWIGYAVIFVLLVMIMLVSLMPSKRSHQD